MLNFHRQYFTAALLLFCTEILIALFAHDNFIRPYFGDLLVVILLYCLVKSFYNFPVRITSMSVLLFSYLIETLQYFNLVHHLGLDNSNIANILIGNSFAWLDILAYTLGIFLVLWIEKFRFSESDENFNQIRSTENLEYFI